MDEIGAVAIVILALLGLAGVPMLVGGSFDSSVVNACKTNGYWQTGQTRIICSVEEKKK